MQSQGVQSQGAVRNAIIYGMVIVAFGIAVPAAKGLDFLDPVLLSAYACLGIVFAGPAAAKAFEKRPTSLAQAVKWIAKAVLLGESVAVAMLACGVATVYERNRAAFFPPDLESLAYAALLGLAGSLALASLGALVSLTFSPGAARMTMRLTFLGLLALFYLRGRWLPNVAEIGTLVCLFFAGAFVLLLKQTLAAR